MASDANLNIILRLIDEASAKLKTVTDEIKGEKKAIADQEKEIAKETQKQDDAVDKSKQKQKTALQNVNKELRSLRSQLTIFAIAVGFATVVTKQWATTNDETRETLQELGIVGKQAINSIADTLSKLYPILTFMAGLVKPINDMFGDKQITNIERAKNAIKNFQEDVGKLKTLFVAGAITASEYFSGLMEFQDSVIGQNQRMAASYEQLSVVIASVKDRNTLLANAQIQEQIALLNYYKATVETAHQGMKAFTVKIGTTIQQNLSGTLVNLITGVQEAKEAFADLGMSLVKVIVDFMIQKLVAAALEKTLLKGTVAASTAAAAEVAAAWAPAALAVSLATAGSNAIGAGAGIMTTTAILAGAMAGIGVGLAGKGAGAASAIDLGTVVVSKHDGGMIRAHNGLAVDEVPIIAQSGEGVLSRRGMAALGGERELNRLNKGQGTSGGDINITVNYPRFNAKEDIDKLINILGIEIQRELKYARVA